MVSDERSRLVMFVARWWVWILFGLFFALGLLFAFVIPITPAKVVPVIGLLIGIAWGAFVPYVEASLEYAKEAGTWLQWDHTYTVAPIATMGLGMAGFAALFLFVPGAFQEVTTMSFVTAAAFGRAGKETWDDGRRLQGILK